MGALIFIAVIVAWALILGRSMGGTGTWYPTGAPRETIPACNCFAGPGELHLSDCPLQSDENLIAVEARLAALVDDPDAGLTDAEYWAEISR